MSVGALRGRCRHGADAVATGMWRLGGAKNVHGRRLPLGYHVWATQFALSALGGRLLNINHGTWYRFFFVFFNNFFRFLPNLVESRDCLSGCLFFWFFFFLNRNQFAGDVYVQKRAPGKLC